MKLPEKEYFVSFREMGYYGYYLGHYLLMIRRLHGIDFIDTRDNQRGLTKKSFEAYMKWYKLASRQFRKYSYIKLALEAFAKRFRELETGIIEDYWDEDEDDLF